MMEQFYVIVESYDDGVDSWRVWDPWNNDHRDRDANWMQANAKYHAIYFVGA